MTERTPALPRQPPAWLRRGIVYALAGVAVYQVAVWAFRSLSHFLGLLFLAWLFAISIEPVVHRLEQRGMRRGLATGLVMFCFVLLVAAFVGVFGALLVDQLGELIRSTPEVVRSVISWVNDTFGTNFLAGDVVDALRLTPERIQELAQNFSPDLVGFVTTTIGVVFQGFTLLLFAFYMSAEGPKLRDVVSRRFPARQQRVIATVWTIAVEKTGGYVVSRLVLAALCTVVTAIFLLVLGVPYWLPLAIWTGFVSQFIPTIGTYLAILLPALIALAEQPRDAIWVVIFGTVYQQIENYLLAPHVTSRTVFIHPAVAFGAVIVGASLFGPLGGLVAIPVVAAIEAVVQTYWHRYELVGEDDDEPPPVADGEPQPSSRNPQGEP
jgi:predicted PurR-regulated permease PerM